MGGRRRVRRLKRVHSSQSEGPDETRVRRSAQKGLRAQDRLKDEHKAQLRQLRALQQKQRESRRRASRERSSMNVAEPTTQLDKRDTVPTGTNEGHPVPRPIESVSIGKVSLSGTLCGDTLRGNSSGRKWLPDTLKARRNSACLPPIRWGLDPLFWIHYRLPIAALLSLHAMPDGEGGLAVAVQEILIRYRRSWFLQWAPCCKGRSFGLCHRG